MKQPPSLLLGCSTHGQEMGMLGQEPAGISPADSWREHPAGRAQPWWRGRQLKAHCPLQPPAPAFAISFLGNQRPRAFLGMILEGFVAGAHGQGEENMPGHICGQGVLPRKATSLVPSTQLRLLASSHHRLALWQYQGRAGFATGVQRTMG